MNTIEITVKVNESKEEVVQKLIKNGFHQTSDEYGEDIYMTNELENLNKNNIREILNKSLLIRHHYGEYREARSFLITKDKKYNENKVMSETILSTKIDDTKVMTQILEKVGFKELIRKKQHFNDFTKDDVVFILQEVDGIGLLIEYESKKDFTNKTDEEIKREKEKMHSIIKSFGIDVSDNYDIQKAYELIQSKYFGK